MKNGNKSSRAEKRSLREMERLISQTGLKGSAREMARQYGRGLLEGMNIACLAVAERLIRAGNSKSEIEAFFADMLDAREIEELMREAQG